MGLTGEDTPIEQKGEGIAPSLHFSDFATPSKLFGLLCSRCFFLFTDGKDKI